MKINEVSPRPFTGDDVHQHMNYSEDDATVPA